MSFARVLARLALVVGTLIPLTAWADASAPAIEQLRAQGLYDSLLIAVEATRYRVSPRPATGDSPAGYDVTNPAQRFGASFDASGLELRPTGESARWRVGLRLEAWGSGQRLVPPGAARMTAAGNRVEYRYAVEDAEDLTEWYVNTARGIEQGFTLARPPAGPRENEPLTLVVSVTGDLTARLAASGRAIELASADGTAVLGYSGLRAWDASGRTLPSQLAVETGRLRLAVDDHDAVYPVMVDPLVYREAKLTASHGFANDFFGISVAISGDTVVVGAPAGGAELGQAYVYVRQGTAWSEQATLVPSDLAGNFGATVAISGDTIVIGESERVVVFVRSGTVWSEQATLLPSDGTGSDGFGTVAISGDTVVVGALYYDTDDLPDAGQAYVYVRDGSTWTEQAKLAASDRAAGDSFGVSVGISGDTIVVGAPNHATDDLPSTGQAYVYVRNGTTWSEQAKLAASDRAAGDDHFGSSVAIDGDTVVVGAPYHDTDAVHDSGQAYVYVRSGTVWSEQARLSATDGTPDNFFADILFGTSVAISGDNVAVGAPRAILDRSTLAAEGQAYVYVRRGTGWSEQGILAASDHAIGDQFGASVGITQDSVVVGTASAITDKTGKAYVYVPAPGLTLTVASINPISGVPIAVSPSDNTGQGAGTTPFTRRHDTSTPMTLTAPATTGGKSFGGWVGCTSALGVTCFVTPGANRTVTALFVDSPTVKLTVTKIGSGTVTSAPIGIDCGPDCAGDYTLNTAVTLTATPAPGFGFLGFTGACVTTNATCPVTMSAAKAVTATFTSVKLTVTRLGLGRVTSDVPGVDCGTDCVGDYAPNKIVTLTAQPLSPDESAFKGWTGACVTANATCVVTMNAAKAVTATFTSVRLTVIKVGSGSVTSVPAGIDCGTDCVGDYALNRVVTLSATPAPGFGFLGFAGGCVTTNATCSVTMSAAKAVTATFARFALTVTTAGTGAGSVSGDGIACVRPAGVANDCTETYPAGTLVTLTATPISPDQSAFTGWSGACVFANATCTVTMTAAKAVTATFTSVKLSVIKVGSGSVTSAPAGIDCGTDCVGDYALTRVVTLTATPAPGFGFLGFTGACVTTNATCAVTMNTAKSVTATFARFALTVTTAGTGAGSVAGPGIACVRPAGVGNDCTETYPAGTLVTLTATPTSPDQSAFTGWTGACVSTNATCTVTLNATKAVAATFASVKLTVTRLGLGRVTSDVPGVDCGLDCVGDYAPNKIVTLTAQPLSPDESAFKGWTGACVSTNATCTVTMTAAKAVTATFTSVKLSVIKVGSGSVTSAPAGIDCGTDCVGDYALNRVVTLTATPAPGFGFLGFTSACVTTDTICQVTMTAGKTVTATFARFPLTVTTAGTGAGSVSGDGIACVRPAAVGNDCTESYPARTLVTLTATPTSPDQSAFTGWTGACVSTNATCIVTMNAAQAVTATFASVKLTVTRLGLGRVTSDVPGVDCGTDCVGDYAPNKIVTLTAQPLSPDESAFTGWTGACVSANATCTVTMTAAKAVTATFTSVKLTVIKVGSGSVTSAPAGIDCGTDCVGDYGLNRVVTLTATPAPGFGFLGFTGACVTTNATCPVTMNTAKSVTATFKQFTPSMLKATFSGLVSTVGPPDRQQVMDLTITSTGPLAGTFFTAVTHDVGTLSGTAIGAVATVSGTTTGSCATSFTGTITLTGLDTVLLQLQGTDCAGRPFTSTGTLRLVLCLPAMGGTYTATETSRLLVCAQGECAEENVSGSATVALIQNGCQVEYLPPNAPDDSFRRRGTIQGNRVTMTGKIVGIVDPSAPIVLNTNSATLTGTIADETHFVLTATGSATGTFQGIPFTVRATGSAEFQR